MRLADAPGASIKGVCRSCLNLPHCLPRAPRSPPQCYKTEAGDLRIFRPHKNFDRFKRSAARLGLPDNWDNDELTKLLCKLLALGE